MSAAQLLGSHSSHTIDSSKDYGYTRDMVTTVVVAERWGTPLSDFVKFMRASGLAPSTLQLRSYQIRKLSQALGGAPDQVTGDDLVSHLAAHHDTWGLSYMRAARSAYRAFFTWMHDTDRMPENPAGSLPKIKAQTGKPRPANVELISAAMNRADERTRWMMCLGVYAGLRRHEIAKVHTRDLIHDADGGYSLRVLGKGRKLRIVPLAPVVAGWLLSLPEGWAFPSHHRGWDDGTPADRHLQADAVGKAISKAFEHAATSHQLRHRFASDMYVTTNSDIRAVQEALGHSSVATTQIYTEVPQTALRRGVDGLRRY